jgi:hypothetical protein
MAALQWMRLGREAVLLDAAHPWFSHARHPRKGLRDTPRQELKGFVSKTASTIKKSGPWNGMRRFGYSARQIRRQSTVAVAHPLPATPLCFNQLSSLQIQLNSSTRRLSPLSHDVPRQSRAPHRAYDRLPPPRLSLAASLNPPSGRLPSAVHRYLRAPPSWPKQRSRPRP